MKLEQLAICSHDRLFLHVHADKKKYCGRLPANAQALRRRMSDLSFFLVAWKDTIYGSLKARPKNNQTINLIGWQVELFAIEHIAVAA